MSSALNSRQRGSTARGVLSFVLNLGILLAPSVYGAVGPTSTLYITNYGEFSSGTVTGLDMIQGVTVNSVSTGYAVDICIAAAGDIRTFGYGNGDKGGQFDLAGNVLGGGPYTNTTANSQYHDGTADGTYNYTVDYPTGDVLRFNQNWTSPSTLFTLTPATAGWITMNPTDSTFWISQYGGPDLVEHRSYSGTLLGSFNSGVFGSQGLALDPIDGTLWMSQGFTLYQFNQAGTQLQNLAYSLPGQWYGMEFDTTVPEPVSMTLVGVGMMLMGLRRR